MITKRKIPDQKCDKPEQGQVTACCGGGGGVGGRSGFSNLDQWVFPGVNCADKEDYSI